ncbi:hypothetical protein H920_06487 [Fukomys damarensis]|uniref:Small integral membrane protein 15 n=6 Tax=Eutheria TaxID=9347 RepID=A0A091EA96_FUKDA|nr:hypothetical protein H920_06487 [Fukomys damarensis]
MGRDVGGLPVAALGRGAVVAARPGFSGATILGVFPGRRPRGLSLTGQGAGTNVASALAALGKGRRTATEMFDVKAWAEYVVEWAAKDPYGFLTTVILALTPLFLASAVLSWKLAKMIEAREKEQKKKQKRQENIAKAKRLKKD